MDDRGGLFLFATIRPKPEHLDKARAAIDDLIPKTLAEPGCHLFAAFESGSEDGVLHLSGLCYASPLGQPRHLLCRGPDL